MELKFRRVRQNIPRTYVFRITLSGCTCHRHMTISVGRSRGTFHLYNLASHETYRNKLCFLTWHDQHSIRTGETPKVSMEEFLLYLHANKASFFFLSLKLSPYLLSLLLCKIKLCFVQLQMVVTNQRTYSPSWESSFGMQITWKMILGNPPELFLEALKGLNLPSIML